MSHICLKSKHIFYSEVDDSLGREVNLTVWNHPGNDVTGIAARSEKIVNAAEKVQF